MNEPVSEITERGIVQELRQYFTVLNFTKTNDLGRSLNSRCNNYPIYTKQLFPVAFLRPVPDTVRKLLIVTCNAVIPVIKEIFSVPEHDPVTVLHGGDYS